VAGWLRSRSHYAMKVLGCTVAPCSLAEDEVASCRRPRRPSERDEQGEQRDDERRVDTEPHGLSPKAVVPPDGGGEALSSVLTGVAYWGLRASTAAGRTA
jgi:hypothetical protein